MIKCKECIVYPICISKAKLIVKEIVQDYKDTEFDLQHICWVIEHILFEKCSFIGNTPVDDFTIINELFDVSKLMEEFDART